MAFDTQQQRRAALGFGSYPVILPFPSGTIDSEALQILGSGYSYLTTILVLPTISARFWELRDWMEFTLDGVEYIKIRPQYDVNKGRINAIVKTTGVGAFILARTVVLPASDAHTLQKRPIVCQPVLQPRERRYNPNLQ